MRHKVKGRKLGRNQSHRDALGCNLVASLFRHERIVTTVAKAKEYKPMAERLITLGKKGTLHDRRRAVAILHDVKMVKKLFDEIAPRFKDRPGGYTRILKLQATSDHRRSGMADAPRLRIRRLGDAGPTCYFELVTETVEESRKANEARFGSAGKNKPAARKKAPKKAASEPAADAAAESGEDKAAE